MPIDFKRYPILFVDDEAPVRKTLRYALEDRFSVITESSGERALAALRRKRVSVLLTDHRMPGMTGVELCVQAHELRPHLVTMIVTAYADIGAAIDAIKRGQVSAYIPKPWIDEHLVAALGALITRLDEARTARELGIGGGTGGTCSSSYWDSEGWQNTTDMARFF